MIKVSVIIPIYKVEAFIERCATTLMEQTLREVEYIFVDDATPDQSVRILEKVISCYPERKNHVHIIHHKENKGLPAARNTGLSIASGKYVFHCDSDDYLERDMLDIMVGEAERANADYVWCDYFLSYEKKERYMKQPGYTSSNDALKGILKGMMKYNVWNKIVRRSLYIENNILFPDGYGLGEDMTMIKLLASSKKVVYVSRPLYHYVQYNSSSFTACSLSRNISALEHNTLDTIRFIKKRMSYSFEKEINYFLLNVKLPLLISLNRKDFKQWESMYVSSNKFIWSNRDLSFRIRMIQWLATKKLWSIIWLHNYLVYQVIYKIIY